MIYDKYLQRKQKLQQNLRTTIALLDELNLKHAKIKLQAYHKKLEDEKFSIVVIGEFSRGKSTFVNAMLGKSILPSSKQPTTNIISKIVYGTRPSHVLHYKDGKKKSVSDKEFLDIKAQAEADPSNLEKVKSFFKKTEDFSNIDFAEIAYPLSFCQNNVEVVDTPGTNDLNVGRMEITYGYLKKAEAAILLLGADQALSKSEKEFLRERVLGNQIQDIFIVINYKDVLSGPAEEQRVKQYVLDNLSDLGDFSKRIFMVSSKQALLFRRKESGESLKAKTLLMLPDSMEETGFPEFENALAYFLSEEKGAAKLKKYVSCCQNSLIEAEKDLQIKKESVSHSADELREKLRKQQPKYEQTKAETRKIIRRLRSQLLMEESRLEQKAEVTANRIKLAAVQSIDNYRDGMSSQAVQYLVDSSVTPIEKQFIADINELQQQAIREGTKNAVWQLQKIWKDMDFSADSLPISHEIAALADIDTGSNRNNNDEAFGNAASAGLLLWFLAGPAVGLLAAAAGWFLSGGENPFDDRTVHIKNQVRKQYNKILEGFSKEITRQYRKTVDEITDSMQEEIDNRLDTMEQQLKTLISAKESKERDADKEASLLDRQFAEMKRIRANLAEVLEE